MLHPWERLLALTTRNATLISWQSNFCPCKFPPNCYSSGDLVCEPHQKAEVFGSRFASNSTLLSYFQRFWAFVCFVVRIDSLYHFLVAEFANVILHFRLLTLSLFLFLLLISIRKVRYRFANHTAWTVYHSSSPNDVPQNWSPLICSLPCLSQPFESRSDSSCS